jgi:hypothetical protein
MLPHELLTVREIGDTDLPYWTACCADGVQLSLEPGESLLYVGYCRVSQLKPQKWQLPDRTTLVVTDRRIAFLTTQFDTGGGWAGFGVVGLAVATSANMVSKHRAAQRSAGKVAIGQARHEWITGIALRTVRALIGVTDDYLDLTVASSAGPRILELWGRGVVNTKFAHWLAGVVAGHRMVQLSSPSTDAEETLQRYQQGGHDTPPPSGRQNSISWTFPGDIDELIGVAWQSRSEPPG